MKKLSHFLKTILAAASCALVLSACSGPSTSSGGGGGAVTGVATPSKVSVVNTN